MNPELWNRAKQILPEVRELPPKEKAPFLDEACEGDPELRREVESFLATDPAALAFIEQPPIRLLDEDDTAIRKDSQIGAYRILRRLGSGGMGIVYLATRVGDEFRREVAIKVLQTSQASQEAERRFLQEMGILAKLNHLNIAKLYEGGRTEDGRLYYLMEYVQGRRIDVYCREEKLSLEQRLRLFQKVCGAIQYAHTQLVVHRDIKPGNVLVTADGEPKLLDFGVAKPLEGAGIGNTVLTGGDQKLFTPDYASPEQITGQTITTASDVYSLGVLLYELLAGDRPYRLKSGLDDEIRRLACEEPSKPPNSVFVQSPDSTGDEPLLTDPTITGFRRRLQGDLDTIVMMALRKEPERRYSSVEQLSEDIRRHLEGHTILARKSTLVYRARKFLRRNRYRVGLAALFLVAAGIAAFALARQHQETRRERNKFEAIAGFMTELFESTDPEQLHGRDLTAEQLLDQGAEKLAGRFQDEPEIRSDLLNTLGEVYYTMGLFERAKNLLQEALELRQQIFGHEHLKVADSHLNLGVCLVDMGELHSGMQQKEESLRIRRRILGDDHPLVAEVLSNLAYTYYEQARFERAAEIQLQALQIRESELGPDHPDIAESLNLLGLVYKDQGRLDEAENVFLRSLAIVRKSAEGPDPAEATRLHNLALVNRAQERFDQAEKYHREAAATLEKIYGPRHPDVATALGGLALVLKKIERYDEALTIQKRVLEIRKVLFGLDNPRTALSLNNLGRLYIVIEDYEQAQLSLEQALEINQRILRPDHPQIATNLVNLGDLYHQNGSHELSESSYRRAIVIFERENHARLSIALTRYANLLKGIDRNQEATELEARVQELEIQSR